MPQFHLLSRQNVNTLQTVTSKLRLKLLTDSATNKPISKEQLLVLTPDGKVVACTTDDNGIAEVNSVPAPPLSFVYVVLPNILEGWSSDYQLQTSFPIIAELDPPELGDKENGGKDRFLIDPQLHVDLTELYRGLSKDAVMELATGVATHYRSKDYTKHLCLTQKANSGKTLELRVDRLPAQEKFDHFREFIEGHDVRYFPGKMNYDKKHHFFTFQAGAVCNQFANFFLGFWLNHNSAFTTVGSVSDFGTILDKFASKMNSYTSGDKHTYHFRGYKESCAAVVAPKGVPSETYEHYEYINSDMKDATIWDAGAHRYVSDALMSKLDFINVFCITDSSGGHMKVGHHGGLMVRKKTQETDDKGTTTEKLELHKLAADGYPQEFFKYDDVWYPYPDASKHKVETKHLSLTGKPASKKSFYTQGNLGYHLMDEASYKNRNDLHLRLWALKPLRPGGYAPGDDADSYTSANYVAIDSAAKLPDDIDSSSTNFRLWPPRFITWGGVTDELNIEEKKAECGKLDDFLGIKSNKYTIKYTLTTHDKKTKEDKVTEHLETYEGKEESFARLAFDNDHTKDKAVISITEVKELTT